ncbi:nucleoside hydrolase [Dictyobacter arantiisoli]|uniref:Ribosylpyrimidine nucleosidase n=1 Tax=Dictyobacter arantiisoli TaxID=2014874 RepID=A0A5A5T8A3_9CHLR|nr:nucleoside hydrolase [Dictyobacter arantiisoli]GCF07710.1 ribosylpyrimidine nucleosidase [Dictyobacter arantiisoli]
MRQKIILDCDPGHDDAIALLLAARHPALELLAVTTVAGNQSVEKTSLNALKICSLAHIEQVPISKGMNQPLIRRARHAADIHGDSGLDGPALPTPYLSLTSQHAVDVLIDLLLQSDGDIILIPTGPLTNIATAMRRAPAIIPKIKAISLMGGAISVGNVTASAEFNIWADPEAAALVFACGRPITMVPLEVTHQALATEAIMQRLQAMHQAVPDFVIDLMRYFGESYRQVFGFAAPPLHDPCAVAAVIDPDIIVSKDMHVDIETRGEWTEGRTVCDLYGKTGLPPNVQVGYALHVERFWDLLLETLALYA